MSGLPQVDRRASTSRVVGRAVAAMLWLMALGAVAQVPPAEPKVVPPAEAIMPAAVAPAAAPPPAAPADLALRLDAIAASTASLLEKANKPDYTPLKFSLVGTLGGVILGGIVTILVQRKILANQLKLAQDAATNAKLLADAKAKQDRELAQDRATLEVRAAIVQWRLKQLSELYGPLYALLRQSHTLYRHMNNVLATGDPAKFRLQKGSEGDDFDRQVFEINVEGKWTRFRTVMHLALVYGQGHAIEDYFNEVVATGARMAKVIQEKAGLVRPEQSDLVVVFGRYLAHYSVLERVHAHLKTWYDAAVTSGQKPTTAAPALMNVDVSAVFPSEIQKLVDAGFDDISAELSQWRAKS